MLRLRRQNCSFKGCHIDLKHVFKSRFGIKKTVHFFRERGMFIYCHLRENVSFHKTEYKGFSVVHCKRFSFRRLGLATVISCTSIPGPICCLFRTYMTHKQVNTWHSWRLLYYGFKNKSPPFLLFVFFF